MPALSDKLISGWFILFQNDFLSVSGQPGHFRMFTIGSGAVRWGQISSPLEYLFHGNVESTCRRRNVDKSPSMSSVAHHQSFYGCEWQRVAFSLVDHWNKCLTLVKCCHLQPNKHLMVSNATHARGNQRSIFYTGWSQYHILLCWSFELWFVTQ